MFSSLLVIGADFSIRERLGALSFPIPLLFYESLASVQNASFPSASLFLSPFPLDTEFDSFNFHQQCLIGCGTVQHLGNAFALGVHEYLVEPWTSMEAQARIERLLNFNTIRLPGSSLLLSGLSASQNKASISLSKDEAFILRCLMAAYPEPLSRHALQSFLWPQAEEHSRVVDNTISHLRKKMYHLSSNKEGVQIRSIRGFGYTLQTQY